MNWLYSKWWKWLCVVLLLYVVVGSFLVPLGPGLSGIDTINFTTDSVYTFTLHCYHSHFKSPEVGKVQVWFKNGNDYYCPKSLAVVDDNTIQAQFSVAKGQKLNQPTFDLVLNDHIDGTFALRDAVALVQNSDNAPAGDSTTTYTAKQCPVEVQNNKAAFLAFPYREILYESIRNTFFHVPMWFTMTALVLFSLYFSIKYLRKGNLEHDVYAHQAIVGALLFGACGLMTGSVWARYTWGQFWVNDPKLNGAAIGVSIYLAYLILRGAITDEIKRARIAATYNVFSIVIFMLFIFIMPRLTDSLHPGNGGNPAFSKYDLDNTLRMFFYPAVIGWVLLGFWIVSILIRLQLIKHKQEA
ncbi:MAG TPA: cytochrome c biogenesis protein CcsA [Chitinophagales bacterium]|nr:cytochrome c biogenesis protein CcsA [Chitinophagales bacterium]